MDEQIAHCRIETHGPVLAAYYHMDAPSIRQIAAQIGLPPSTVHEHRQALIADHLLAGPMDCRKGMIVTPKGVQWLERHGLTTNVGQRPNSLQPPPPANTMTE